MAAVFYRMRLVLTVRAAFDLAAVADHRATWQLQLDDEPSSSRGCSR
jgi:hypothetical protein